MNRSSAPCDGRSGSAAPCRRRSVCMLHACAHVACMRVCVRARACEQESTRMCVHMCFHPAVKWNQAAPAAPVAAAAPGTVVVLQDDIRYTQLMCTFYLLKVLLDMTLNCLHCLFLVAICRTVTRQCKHLRVTSRITLRRQLLNMSCS